MINWLFVLTERSSPMTPEDYVENRLYKQALTRAYEKENEERRTAYWRGLGIDV